MAISSTPYNYTPLALILPIRLGIQHRKPGTEWSDQYTPEILVMLMHCYIYV
jgi:hypothetical protein